MNYEEALKKAKKIKPDINICIEKTSAFIFGHEGGEISEGGSNTPVVIMKEKGNAVSMPYYNANYPSDKQIKIIKI